MCRTLSADLRMYVDCRSHVHHVCDPTAIDGLVVASTGFFSGNWKERDGRTRHHMYVCFLGDWDWGWG